MSSASLELLTDEAILDYTRSNGVDRVLYDHRDLMLKFVGVHPVPGGLYDVDIFGSPILDRCICGKLKQPSPEPCPNCGARVFTKAEALRRFARVELPFYYLNSLRFDIFKSLFEDIFSKSKIQFDIIGDDLKRRGFSGRGSKTLGIKLFDTCQFEYFPDTKTLIVTERITDLEKCSYEGLIKVIKEHFPGRLTEFMKLINRYYLIQPAVMRPFTLFKKGGRKMTGPHKLSRWYRNVVAFCCVEARESNPVNYEEAISRFSTPGEKARYNAVLRALLNAGKKEATELLNSSKQNLARNLYSVRTQNSARCPIVPSTTLAIDEIGVPTSVAYEMCREGFLKHLQAELNFTEKEALKATKEEALNPETQKMFKEYAEKQIVLG